MNWPLMLLRTHKRRHIAQGHAYRSEIAELRKRAEKAERAQRDLAANLVKHVSAQPDFPDGGVRVSFVLSPLFLREPSRADLPRLIGERVVSMVYGLHHDWRGDLRQTETQRLLGMGR